MTSSDNNFIGFEVTPDKKKPRLMVVTLHQETFLKFTYKINLYNVEGQLVQTYTNLVVTQKNIDVTNFNNGLHIMKVYFEDGVVTKKVMIQK